MENDKYKNYFNDEGEFLIPFEQLEKVRNPRQFLLLRRVMFTCFGVITVGIIGLMLTHLMV